MLTLNLWFEVRLFLLNLMEEILDFSGFVEIIFAEVRRWDHEIGWAARDVRDNAYGIAVVVSDFVRWHTKYNDLPTLIRRIGWSASEIQRDQRVGSKVKKSSREPIVLHFH